MSTLRLAIQNKGRLNEKSLKLLEDCGIYISRWNLFLKTLSLNFPIEILFLRDDDIPQYVERGVSDLGILGLNEIEEKNRNIEKILPLGFSHCKLCLAIPKESEYYGLQYFNKKRIATSYPNILSSFFKKENIEAEIETISGSVEVAPGIGLSDGVFDLVSTGSTLSMNGLKTVETLMYSQATLVANPNIIGEKKKIMDQLLFRIRAVLASKKNKYILLNAPNSHIDAISNILPGIKSPTIVPLKRKGWSSIHSVVREDDFWEVIKQLKENNAEGILVVPIEKMIL